MLQSYGYRPTTDVEPGIPPREPAGASSANRLPTVQGRCPSRGAASLFLGDGDFVTCAWAECPEPDAASTLLERDPRTVQQCPCPANPFADCRCPPSCHVCHPAETATCGLVIPGIGAAPLGPCIREPHDDHVHRAANGATWLPTSPVEQARATVGAVTREQLHDAIRTLARRDPAWWRDELRRYSIAQAVTSRGFPR